MTDSTCSYCKNENHRFEVSGMRKLKGDDFTKYQLCKSCNSMLSNLNPRVDADKRRKVWDVIWENAQQSPL